MQTEMFTERASEPVGLQWAKARFVACPGGVPRDADDFGAICLLSASGDSAATIRIEKELGERLTFSDERRKALLGWAIGAAGLPMPTEERRQALEISVRIRDFWGRVVQIRQKIQAQALRLRELLLPLLPEGCDLDEHQILSLCWFTSHDNRMLLADEMGLGKTISALAPLLLEQGPFPVLIVCPASMLYTWKREIGTWLKKLNPTVFVADHPFETSDIVSLERPILIVSYDRMIRQKKEILVFQPKFIVGDESHYLKTWDSQRTRAFLQIRSHATHRLLLSGTPMPNGRHAELYPQIKILDAGAFSSLGRGSKDRWAYLHRYCDPKTLFLGKKRVTTYDGRSNEVELGALLDRFQLRRTKAEAGLSLPSLTRYALEVPMSDSDRIQMARIVDGVRAEVQQEALRIEAELREKGLPEEKVQDKAKQMLGSEALRRVFPIRRFLGLLKAKFSVCRVREHLDEGHRVLLFAYHVEVAEQAASLYHRYLPEHTKIEVATGEMSSKNRDDLVQRAQGGEIDVLVLTRAFREGITLTAFDRGGMLERFWVPGEESQAEARNHRRGQTRPVAWDYYVCTGTMDDVMGELVTWKEKGQTQIVGSAEQRVLQWLLASH